MALFIMLFKILLSALNHHIISNIKPFLWKISMDCQKCVLHCFINEIYVCMSCVLFYAVKLQISEWEILFFSINASDLFHATLFNEESNYFHYIKRFIKLTFPFSMVYLRLYKSIKGEVCHVEIGKLSSIFSNRAKLTLRVEKRLSHFKSR